MGLYPTALLTGLLLTFLASDLQDVKAIDAQALQSFNQPPTATHSSDSSTEPFHRGSGRCQFWATLANV